MSEPRTLSTSVLVALIAAAATIAASVAPRLWDRYVEGTEARPAAPAPTPTVRDPVGPVEPPAPLAPATDPVREAWGAAIARMNHANPAASVGQFGDRVDTHGDGYAELQREDRDRDGLFELYRVDSNGDNTTDYWFWVDVRSGLVYAVPPR